MIYGFSPAAQKSNAATASGQFEPNFSRDFLGSFIEAPIAKEAIIKQARISEERSDDPFINYQVDNVANKLADTPAQKSAAQCGLQIILALGHVKKAPWWIPQFILALFSKAKGAEKEAFIPAPSTQLEQAQISLEKLSQKLDKLHQDHLYNENGLDQDARKKDHALYLDIKGHIQQTYSACLAELALSRGKGNASSTFLEAFESVDFAAQQARSSRDTVNERLLIVEGNASLPSRHSSKERIIRSETFAESWSNFGRFAKTISLEQPEEGFVKRIHDFVHSDATSEVVATSSAAANLAMPGSGLAINGGATVTKSIIKGVMHSNSSFRTVKYKNAFRVQLKKELNLAFKEVDDMSGISARDIGHAAGVINNTNQLIFNELKIIKENQRKQEEDQRKQTEKYVTRDELRSTINLAAREFGLHPNGSTNSLNSNISSASESPGSVRSSSRETTPETDAVAGEELISRIDLKKAFSKELEKLSQEVIKSAGLKKEETIEIFSWLTTTENKKYVHALKYLKVELLEKKLQLQKSQRDAIVTSLVDNEEQYWDLLQQFKAQYKVDGLKAVADINEAINRKIQKIINSPSSKQGFFA